MTRLALVGTTDADLVRAVIREETEAFIARDFDRWQACWRHDARCSTSSYSEEFGLHVERGWDEVGGNMRQAMAAGLNCGLSSFESPDLTVTVSGDMAWAVYEQISRHDDRADPVPTFETRVLEREDGRWKIVYASFALRMPFGSGGGVVAVDSSRRVVRAEGETLTFLKDHPALTVSQGVLRGKKPAWDKALAEAVARAEAYLGFWQAQRFTADTGRPFRIPAVLGEDDEGRVLVVMVTTRDGLVHIDTRPDADIGQRLRMAGAIFGLSDAQMALAERIVAGEGMTAAAEALGISVNTARTHLARIYDKTGVNAQTALVRLLLSVG